jgi:translocation and assembly module TamA
MDKVSYITRLLFTSILKRVMTLVVVLGLISAPAAAKTKLNIEGLTGDLEKNVEVYLSAIVEKDYSTSLRFQSRVESTVTEALKAMGYYAPTIVIQVDEEKDVLTFTVDMGEPVTIEEVDVVLDGEADQDDAFHNLLQQSAVQKGAILNHGDYDALKSGIRNMALRRGYFDGTFTLSRLEVSPERKQAFVRLHYTSGIRYNFGTTLVQGSQIEESKVQSLIPYEEGQPYLASDIGSFNQNLSSTGWFGSIYIEPDLSQVGKGRDIPVNVQLSPQSQNQIETGLGYSTDVGIRGTLKWKKPWINRFGHSFDSSFQLSQPEQIITVGYEIPLEDVLNEYYRFAYGMKHLDNRDTESLEATAAVERHWQLDSGWHRTLYLKAVQEDFLQGSQDDSFFMLLPGIAYSKTRSRGGAMPTWGDKQRVSVEYGDENFFSETQVLRLSGNTTWIRSIGSNHRGIARLDGRSNFTEDVTRLPPSLRYFAGGDNNLRGYGYESIAPVDDDGQLIGAKYMVTSTLEYQYRVYGNWWLAAFVDYGDAFSETPEWKTGTGVGVRWASPIGPVRLDFALGLDAPEGDQFQFHFGIGPEL